jgi:plastocyanin
VSADGLVQAIGVGDGIGVVAFLRQGNLTHADTVMINVTDAAAPPMLAGLTIHPDASDSAKTAMEVPKALGARAIDSSGAPMTGLSVYYTSLDYTTATIDRTTGFLTPIRPGHVAIVATATAYGVTKADTLPFTIGFPLTLFVTISARTNASGQVVNGFTPEEITLGPGATVIFSNNTVAPTDVTFDDPTNVAQGDPYCAFLPPCEAGDIEAWARDPADPFGTSASRVRRFPVPGTYNFHSTLFGSHGSIVIADEHTP